MNTATSVGAAMVDHNMFRENHIPVLKETVVNYLVTDRSGTYIDCTIGGAGHAEAIMMELDDGGMLVGMDVDDKAMEAAGRRLKRFGDRVTLVQANFSSLSGALAAAGLTKADGFLFDLGLSSIQLDAAGRGFSYRSEGPLDMRMDPSLSNSARDVVNWYTKNDLIRIFRDYGEEKYAARISRATIRAREGHPVETTVELASIIQSVIPPRSPQKTLSRIFQAIRIEVNNELSKLKIALQEALAALNPGGRIVVIAYHSLEDRIVKSFFAEKSKGCICPPDFPICACKRQSELKIITRKVVRPDEEEIEINPRAHSARLRAAERKEI